MENKSKEFTKYVNKIKQIRKGKKKGRYIESAKNV